MKNTDRLITLETIELNLERVEARFQKKKKK